MQYGPRGFGVYAGSARWGEAGCDLGSGTARVMLDDPCTAAGMRRCGTPQASSAVVFRPANVDPTDFDEAEMFDNGELIPDTLIRTGQLPNGFPTKLFAPWLVNGNLAIP